MDNIFTNVLVGFLKSSASFGITSIVSVGFSKKPLILSSFKGAKNFLLQMA
jgi:hypothetical protein